eukprot:981632-Prorocentrum_minimum.AAC.1
MIAIYTAHPHRVLRHLCFVRKEILHLYWRTKTWNKLVSRHEALANQSRPNSGTTSVPSCCHATYVFCRVRRYPRLHVESWREVT